MSRHRLLIVSLSCLLTLNPLAFSQSSGAAQYCVPEEGADGLSGLGLSDLAGPVSQALASSQRACPITAIEPPPPRNPNDPNDMMRYNLRSMLSHYVRMRCGAMTGSIASRLLQRFETTGQTPAGIEQQLQQIDSLVQAANSLGVAGQGIEAAAAPVQQMLQALPSSVQELIPGANAVSGAANMTELLASLRRFSQDVGPFRSFLRQLADKPFLQDTIFRCQASCSQTPAVANCHMSFPTSGEWTPVRL